ncbi:hypothetical protein NDU88_001910 [Pleurodeles waltl]|uniref:Uncharacterized protein n=1 Tax=Pleurodeles waltl TaxID=8319 RepID=A0AAV7Q4F9_PLEWA|nr:hypothetical protein NDU88_001910 [Pleurodeles waltl]
MPRQPPGASRCHVGPPASRGQQRAERTLRYLTALNECRACRQRLRRRRRRRKKGAAGLGRRARGRQRPVDRLYFLDEVE